MKIEENEAFLDVELQRFDNGSCGRSEGLRSRSSIILSQTASRSIFHCRRSPTEIPERVEFLIGDDDDYEESFLFTQLNELFTVHDEVKWRETGRWIRFEEKTEDGGERWSKPHVTTLTLHGLFELRTCIDRGIVLLDTEKCIFKEIIEQVLKHRISSFATLQEENKNILNVLLQNHIHQTRKPRTKIIKDIISSTCRSKKSSKRTTLPELCENPSREQLKNKLRRKIPEGTEAANVLVGEVDFLEAPFSAFIRLKEATILSGLTEVALPSRFIFILLGPRNKLKAYHEIGRAMATLLSDELFQKVAYKALHKEDLTAGIDDFLDEVAVLPPGKWDPTVRIQPPKFLPSVQKRKLMMHREAKNNCNSKSYNDDERLAHGHHHISEELQKTTKIFSGLVKDVRRKAPWYWSDFYDALNIQCLSAILYIYLATVTNSITFGGMLGDATDNMQGVLENFIGTAICGGVFCIFAGQPLTILSSTGPVLVFERLLFSFSKTYDFHYLEFRLWIGLWVALFCLLLVATNASYLVQYFTRFTEESFCALISLIFIYDAVKKMLHLADQYPVNWKYNPNDVTNYSCQCILNDTGNWTSWNLTSYNSFHMNEESEILPRNQCTEIGGYLEGNSCSYTPDIFLMSVILFLGTFVCTTLLKSFQSSRYLTTSLRKLIGDFSVILTIVLFCGIDVICGLQTPKLIVPTELTPTNPTRGWFVFPFGGNPWWVCLLSGVPAILITILIFMDQQITAVILNRKDYKLKKGGGLHLDFFCISLLIIVTSFMGLPWYVSATVISLAHMNSLKMETTVSAPGEQPKYLGIREQRVTGLVVFILTGASVFLSPVLKYIPMPVLYGIFLQMGVAALGSIQFMERIQLLFMPTKHQPDLIYLRHVPLLKVHLFTIIQTLCLITLWILKSTAAAIIFPLMLLALAGIRKAMECIFSLHELGWLDDLLPHKAVIEEGPKSEEVDSTDSEDVVHTRT